MSALPARSNDEIEAALRVVSDPADAAAVLNPIRRALLERLETPGSAASLARALRLSRQKVNYHLRELERRGFVEQVEERRRGNCVERIVRATARRYLIDPTVSGGAPDEYAPARDRFSSAALLASSARTLHDVAQLRRRAADAGQRLATLSVEVNVRFASAGRRDEFTDRLIQAVAALAAEHHDEETPDGREFRFALGSHPVINTPEDGDNGAHTSNEEAAS